MDKIENVMTIKKFLFSQVDCIAKNFINKKISHEDISMLMGDDVYSYQYIGKLEDSKDVLVKDDYGNIVAYRMVEQKKCSYQEDSNMHIHITINLNSCDLELLKQYELQRLNKSLIMCGMRNELVKGQMRNNRNRDKSRVRYKQIKRRCCYDKY